MNHASRARPPVLVLLVVLVAATLAPARAASAQDPVAVVDVRPLPGALVTTPAATLQARVVGDPDPEGVRVLVDGQQVDHSARADGRGLHLTATIGDRAPGDHMLEVVVGDGDQQERRTWSITTTRHGVQRLSGPDRFATAVAVSRAAHPAGSAPAAVIARADDFADALAGAPLAAHVGGPLLLTRPDALPAPTARELERVLAPDAPVHVLGGPGAVSADVQAQLEASGRRVVRHAGADRYGTAAAVAAALPSSDTAVVASGRRFPDALAASVPAARSGWPVLLTEPDRLPTATREALRTGRVGHAVVVGGEDAVGRSVAAEVDAVVAGVERVAGPTRFATAVAVADRYLPDATEVAIASGRDHPDALAAAARAAGRGAPLLLVDPAWLPGHTDDALRRGRPDRLVVHGGTTAIGQDVVAAALHATVDGPGAPRVVSTDPASGGSSGTIAPVVLDLDRPVDPHSLVASATLDDVELPTSVRVDEAGTRVVVDPLSPGDLPLDEPRTVQVVLRATGTDGLTLHHRHTFVLRGDRVLATVGSLQLVEPSAAVEVVGYHQSNHEGAQQMAPAQDGPPWHTMDHRGRRTGSRTAADVVADEHVEVVAPVTGRVVRAGTYVLYCDHTDHYAAIEPDGMPGIEVKLLHFRGLRVSPGQRVTAGETVIGDGPRRLPFESQVDEYSSSGYGPHVHVEVVDTSIPNVPNGGSGSEDC